MLVSKVKGLYLAQEGGRYKIEVDQVSAGNWIMISGLTVGKTATVFSMESPTDSVEIFRPIDF